MPNPFLLSLQTLSPLQMLPRLPSGLVPAAGTPQKLWPCRAVVLLVSALKLELQTSDEVVPVSHATLASAAFSQAVSLDAARLQFARIVIPDTSLQGRVVLIPSIKPAN